MATQSFNKSVSTHDADVREAFAYVVGPTGSGKSTLLRQALSRDQDGKGSSVVDYLCVRKMNASGKHDIASVWELPGGAALSAAMAKKAKVSS